MEKWLGHEKNPLEWGWVPNRFGLSPRKTERNAAPESLLKMIPCNCKKGCKNVVAGKQILYVLPCVPLGEACGNVSYINLLEDSIEDEDGTPPSINNFIYEDIEDLYLQLDEEDKKQQTELEDFCPGPSKWQKHLQSWFWAHTVTNLFYFKFEKDNEGCGGLVIGSRPRDRRVAGTKPDSTADPPCMGPLHAKAYVASKRPPVGVKRGGASSGVVLVI
ncbi:hypothetical protein AVEN_82734-1 [Araneus ventricosus]|uniref:Uncharacterized protein n=1 Tax=Araneus ventricosus TaxID=182803 RepID=A0A4Y1ZXF0_ARAVE|nr:hypothetical protein AVEN_82734-1 [Araneus ventricosus]